MVGNVVRRLIRRIHALLREQKGMTLIDTLVALAILGAVGIAFMNALSAGSSASGQVDEVAMTEKLVRNQLEGIKNASYDITAPYEYPIVDHPANYPVSVDIEPNGDNTLQDITITVSHEGETLITVDTLKVKGL